jgi:hypothetical protein
VHVYRGASPATGFLRLTLESLGPALLKAGELTKADADRGLARLDDPGSVFLSAPMITAWGRRC